MCLKNNILIINEGNSDNLGDKAIKKSVSEFYTAHNTELYFSDYTKKNEINITENKNKNKNKNKNLFHFLKFVIPYKLRWLLLNYSRIKKTVAQKYDLVSIGGGQLILSNETFAIALFTWVWSLHFTGSKNIILLSIGVGDKFSFLDRILFKLALNKVKHVYARDLKSIRNLKSIFKVNGMRTFDIAFFHAKNNNTTVGNSIFLGVTDYKVYIKYNPIITRNEYYDSWVEIINRLQKNNTIKLFYTTQSDLDECVKFKEYCRAQYNLNFDIVKTRNLDELNIALSNATTVISGRMHALILAYNLNRNIIAYPISNKLITFNEEIISKKLDNNLIQNKLESMRHTIFSQYIKNENINN
ncbi:polysaccharide pyruvyl transferase family protein [Providencia sp. Je.9.19]|uniref:polysaccharide pyruvyl transferase family protein n=1 Tax=Providencia sp. Je.9.19 TaxID=3142844 RepID=UPI003DAA37B4